MTSQWDFVIAAYAVTAVGTLAVLLHSWQRMRGAEQRAEALRGRDDAPVVPSQPATPPSAPPQSTSAE